MVIFFIVVASNNLVSLTLKKGWTKNDEVNNPKIPLKNLPAFSLCRNSRNKRLSNYFFNAISHLQEIF